MLAFWYFAEKWKRTKRGAIQRAMLFEAQPVLDRVARNWFICDIYIIIIINELYIYIYVCVYMISDMYTGLIILSNFTTRHCNVRLAERNVCIRKRACAITKMGKMIKGENRLLLYNLERLCLNVCACAQSYEPMNVIVRNMALCYGHLRKWRVRNAKNCARLKEAINTRNKGRNRNSQTTIKIITIVPLSLTYRRIRLRYIVLRLRLRIKNVSCVGMTIFSERYRPDDRRADLFWEASISDEFVSELLEFSPSLLASSPSPRPTSEINHMTAEV